MRGLDARWQREAEETRIVRDEWGIAHVHGKTDADAVFGMISAQAEDDFHRVETNYLNALGRLAETEGESRLYQDLRTRLFIDSSGGASGCPPSVRAADGALRKLYFYPDELEGHVERAYNPR